MLRARTPLTHVHAAPLGARGGGAALSGADSRGRRRRYKKKVEKDEEYIKQVKALGDAVEGDIKLNYAIDIYQARRPSAPASAV